MSATQPRPCSVLLVDDDDDARSILSELLRAEGFTILEAANGEEALAAANEAKPDVIVLDVMMPVLDGLGFLERRAAQPNVAAIPVVLLSAVVESLDRAALTAEVVLGKPIDLDLLIGAIRSVAGTPARGTRRAPQAAG